MRCRKRWKQTTAPPGDLSLLGDLRDEQFCYVTTRGRKTGRPHEIEIWFVAFDDSIFLLAGGGEKADWVKNIKANGQVRLRVGDTRLYARGEVGPGDLDEASIRERMAAKYQGWRPGMPLSHWAREALVVRLELEKG